MYLQHTYAAAAGGFFNAGMLYWVAIVLVGALLAAEIWGIVTLVRKLIPQWKARREDKRSYAIAAPLMFSAIPMPLQMTLLVLVICAAVASVCLALLLVFMRVLGYRVQFGEEPVQETEEIPEEAEETETVTEEVTEEIAEETVVKETAAEECAAAEETVEEPEAEVLPPEPETVSVPVRQAARPMPVSIPVYNSGYTGGQVPYVEKHVVETYREVIKETVIERTNPATEELLRAIVELMKVNSQDRARHETEVPRAGDGAVPAYAPAEEDDDVEIEDAAEDAIDSAEAEVETENAESTEDTETEDADGEGGDGDFFSSNERIVGFDEETGCYIVAHYRKSFEAKLIQAVPSVKKYYSEIKNALLAYENTLSRITWTLDSFTNDHTPIAKINVRRKTLDLYLALDPESLDDHIYHGRDVGEKRKYAETPFLFKVNSPRKLMLALELVQRTCEEQGLSPIDAERVDYESAYAFDSTDALVERGLIREYLREEKPTVSFELADEAAIAEQTAAEPAPETEADEPSDPTRPATFEFAADDFVEEAPEETPGEPVEEVAEESAEEVTVTPEETVVTAETVQTTPTETVRTQETVKTTQRKSTEIYYGAPENFARTVTETSSCYRNPIDVITAPEEDAPIEGVAEEIAEAPEEVIETPEEEIVEASEEETVETPEEEIVEDSEEEAVETPEEEAVEAPEEEIVETPEEEAVETPEEEIVETPEEEPVEETPAEDGEWDSFEGILKDIFPEDEEDAPVEEEEAVPAAAYDMRDLPYGTFEVEGDAFEEDEPEEVEETEEEPETPEEEADVYEVEEADGIDDAPFDLDEVPFDTEDTASEESEEAEEVEEIEEEEEVAPPPPPKPAPKPAQAGDPTVAVVDACLFDQYFEDGDLVDLAALKRVGLASAEAKTLRVIGNGSLKKCLTVEANHFTLGAIMAISAADGNSVKV